MTSTYQQSTAETAQDLRSALARHFPGVKFFVRSKRYAGGSSIRVRWTDGPQQWAVDCVADKFAGADFDGMQDLKTHRPNGRGADYVFCDRDISEAMRAVIAEKFAALFGYSIDATRDYADRIAHRMAQCWNGLSGTWHVAASFPNRGELADDNHLRMICGPEAWVSP